MWTRFLDKFLLDLIRMGNLVLHYPDGTIRTYGDGSDPLVTVRLSDPALPGKIIRNPELATGEAYMDERLTIDGDDLYGFLNLMISNLAAANPAWWQHPSRLFRPILHRVRQFNTLGNARRNVVHHYNLASDFYDLFLDTDRQYSCAYFQTPGDTLELAQAQKKAHIAKKLCLKPGQRVLDIGCGWGGMALTLAKDYGVQVLGVTLSEEQHRLASERAAKAGLTDVIEFRLMDYRKVEGQFDRVVSIGMFEHVGAPRFREYFRQVRALLKPDGIALIHTIGRSKPPGTTSPWIDKYIFPGGYVPAMSETMVAVEKEGLVAADIEIWRLHYAQTLKHWYDRFMAHQPEAEAIYDARFCRMWRYYLIASELTFRLNHQVVFQL